MLAVVVALLALLFLLGQQGARLGSWLPPSTVPVWLWLVGAAAVIALPGAARPARPAGVAFAAVALLAVAGPLVSWRARVARPAVALAASVRRLSEPAGRPERVLLPDLNGLRGSPRWYRLLGRNQDFVLEAEAWLWAPRTTTYRFELRADDQATLSVDGAVVLGQESAASAEVALERGPHALAVRHEQTTGSAYLALDWDRPPFVELIPLQGYLAGRPEALNPAALARRHRATLLSLVAAWAWWLGAGLLLVRAGESRRAWPAAVRAEGRLRTWVRARWADPEPRLAVLALLAAAVFLFALEALFRPLARERLYFQEYTSEYLMQTVSVADLRDEPWRSLLYLHIQPPALDALRALLVRLSPSGPDGVLLGAVDSKLYVAWALVYAALVALVGRWLAALASPRFALVATALFALHPAVLFYATLLDSTLLSAAFFCWFAYELWRWPGPRASVARLAASAIALFLTRSVFQWPFLVVLAGSLLLLRAPWRKAAAVLAAVALVMALYIGKQYRLFGITVTSTLAANSFCRGIGLYCLGTTPVPLPELPPAGRARVLSRTAKIDGEYNFNQLAFLKRSFAQMAEYRHELRQQPPRATLVALLHNLRLYFRPSSRYTPHVIVDRLFWRPVYDAVFSGGPLVVLLSVATVFAARAGGLRRTAALALPALYVFAVTVVFEGSENMRYKFFLEPAAFVFLAAQGYGLWARRRPMVSGGTASDAPVSAAQRSTQTARSSATSRCATSLGCMSEG